MRRLERLRAGVRRVEEARAAGLGIERDRLGELARGALARSLEALDGVREETAAWLESRFEFAGAERLRAARLEEAKGAVESDLRVQQGRVVEAHREEQKLGRLSERLQEGEAFALARAEEYRLEEIVLRGSAGGK